MINNDHVELSGISLAINDDERLKNARQYWKHYLPSALQISRGTDANLSCPIAFYDVTLDVSGGIHVLAKARCGAVPDDIVID